MKPKSKLKSNKLSLPISIKNENENFTNFNLKSGEILKLPYEFPKQTITNQLTLF